MSDKERTARLGTITIYVTAPESLESEIDRDALYLALDEMATNIDNFVMDELANMYYPLPAGVELSITEAEIR